MNAINMDSVARSFSRRRTSYDQSAVVQKEMAVILAKDLAALVVVPSPRIFEIGCGTGNLTREILERLNPAAYCANDLFACPEVEEMIKRANIPFEFLEGNAAALNWPNNLDLVCSNAALQWFPDPSRVIARADSALRAGGFFAFSTFLPGNFEEFRQTTGIGLDYLTRHKWLELLGHDWELVRYAEDAETLSFAGPQGVLEHIRNTGVGSVAHRPWTRQNFRHFVENYPRNDEGRCPLSFCFHHFVLRKKGGVS